MRIKFPFSSGGESLRFAIFFFNFFPPAGRSGTGLSKILAWHVQVHAVANEAKPDEEI